jgi:hypothetical protein
MPATLSLGLVIFVTGGLLWKLLMGLGIAVENISGTCDYFLDTLLSGTCNFCDLGIAATIAVTDFVLGACDTLFESAFVRG